MILVVNPNPALDRVAVVEFRKKATLRPLRFSTWAGGSGVHAAHVAHVLGADVLVVGFAGGHTGALFREQLVRQGITADLVPINGETRQTFSLLDVHEGNICDVAEHGPAVRPEEAQELETKVLQRLREADLVIISGSLPDGCPIDLPARIVGASKELGVPCIADLAGNVLTTTISAGPWLIKPSRTELGELMDRASVEIPDALRAAQTWLAAGVENVCISLDVMGVLWVSSEGARQFTPPKVHSFNSIGCGDTLVGALAATYSREHDLEYALRVGVAAAAANLRYDAPGHATPDDITRLIDQVEVRTVNPALPMSRDQA